MTKVRDYRAKGISKEIVNIDDGTSMEMPLGLYQLLGRSPWAAEAAKSWYNYNYTR